MTRPPLTANGIEILARLRAGQSPEHIAAIGWNRSSWSPADIAAVARDWGHRDVETAYTPDARIPHGTYKGYMRCRKASGHGDICQPCREVKRAYDNEQKRGQHRRKAS